jgi:hypothetical protein
MGATGHPPIGRLLQVGGPALVATLNSKPTPHTTGRSAPRSDEVEVRSRVREEPTQPLRLASDAEPSGSSSASRRSCSPGVDLRVVA